MGENIWILLFQILGVFSSLIIIYSFLIKIKEDKRIQFYDEVVEYYCLNDGMRLKSMNYFVDRNDKKNAEMKMKNIIKYCDEYFREKELPSHAEKVRFFKEKAEKLLQWWVI